MKINKEWHEQNKMPVNAGFEQRVAWHLEHEKNCACRPMPARLRQQMKDKEIIELKKQALK